jgi:predicted transcriptional regulator
MPKLVELSATFKRGGKTSIKKKYEYSAIERADLVKIGAGIEKLIRKSGKSVEKFAYEMGLGKGNLSRIVHGRSDVRYCTLRTIAKGLDFKDVPTLLSQIL